MARTETINVDAKKFFKTIDDAIRELSVNGGFTRCAEKGAIYTLKKAKKAAPKLDGELEKSARMEVMAPGSVEISFRRRYAAAQDAGFPGNQIKLKRKKMLYIPLTRRGRQHVYGKDPTTEGLMRGIDYFLKKGPMRVPMKAYGGDRGPNRFLSKTLEKEAVNIFYKITDQLVVELNKVFLGHG